MCKNTFFDFITVQKRLKNVLSMVQTTGQRLLVQSGKYNPDYTSIPDSMFRKNTIMARKKGNLGLCVW